MRAAYVRAVLERECAEVAAARDGRNDRLNRAAFALGQFVGSDALSRSEAESRLFAAAQACGYVASDGAAAARTTIRSGLDKGARSPRRAPEGDRIAQSPKPFESRKELEPLPTSLDDEARRRAAVAVWSEGRSAAGTIVEAYLRSRGLELGQDLDGRVLRFHPRCPWEHGTVPAMLGLYRDIVSDKPVAIHRTALTIEGTKIGRKMLGPVRGAAIKLDDDADVSMGVVIGEGIETCLAARQIGFRPAWALGSVRAISSFPILPGIDGLTLLAEAGEPSAKAIQACGRRWTEAGREVIVASPRIGSDINDALQGKAA